MLTNKFDELSNRQFHIEQENFQLRKDVTSLTATVNSLQLEQAKMHQQVYRNVLTITGVPYYKDENVFLVIRNITTILGIPIESEDIECCRRLKSSSNKITHAIYVEFTTNKLKNEVMEKYKINGPILLEQYLPEGNIPKPLTRASKIIFNNFISNFTMQLLSETRKLKDKYDIKYVWQQNGVVRVRKTEKSTVHFIKSFVDINKLDNYYSQLVKDTHT